MAQAAGVTIELQIRRGPEPYREIVDEARRRGTDLIVIRRRGQRGLLANLLLGEMVRNVVTHAPCGVLVAPRGSCLWTRRVLAAIDPQAEDMSPVATAADLAAACALPLSIVSVAEAAGASMLKAEQTLQRALSMARARGMAVDGVVRSGRPHEQVLAAAREFDADLLVIGRHGDDALGRAWLGGAAQKLIGLANMPVLVCVNARSAKAPTP
jgi:nucleotide-binding universal stress UspA family protein